MAEGRRDVIYKGQRRWFKFRMLGFGILDAVEVSDRDKFNVKA